MPHVPPKVLPEAVDHPEIAAARAEVERTRRRLAASLAALKHEWQAFGRLRAWIDRHPLAIATGVVTLGWIVGWVSAPRRSR